VLGFSSLNHGPAEAISIAERQGDAEETSAWRQRPEIQRAGLALVGAERRREHEVLGPDQPSPSSAINQAPIRAVPIAPRQSAAPALGELFTGRGPHFRVTGNMMTERVIATQYAADKY
jgi:hypothetical protein